ncbi:MAG: Uncharacterised protein [Marinobacterium sp. xm-d-530]|jgi:hypothetical protein|nr:MAG: Uncharacterised protein [Marinobacterium sp. xm-d-530]
MAAISNDHTPATVWALDLVFLLIAISPALIFVGSLIAG